jgi:tRNA (guanine37-N1)-methyltransferase
MAITVDIISIFPEVFAPVLAISMTGRAIERGVLTVHVTDPRDFAAGKHRSTDDTPYGGGSGMVMRPEPLCLALDAIAEARGRGHRILLSPAGPPLRQETVRRLAQMEHLVLVCGRYEGVDERVCNFVDEELSLGDYILSGGELPALVVVDAVARLCPGVLHNVASAAEESFEQGLLEYPQYTKPPVFRELRVPEVLLSGNHERIRRWRRQQALLRTRARRPDLFARLTLSPEDERLLAEADAGREP